MPVSAETFERVASEDYTGKCELVCGHLRGDREIWRIDPHEHTIWSWMWQPGGSDADGIVHSGSS